MKAKTFHSQENKNYVDLTINLNEKPEALSHFNNRVLNSKLFTVKLLTTRSIDIHTLIFRGRIAFNH